MTWTKWADMSPEQRETRRARTRVANMSPERLAKERLRGVTRERSYTPEQNRKRLERERLRRLGRPIELDVWNGIRARCSDPNLPAYKNYGGRGITLCERWRGSDGFENFLADVGPRPSLDYSIDRIDNDGNYEPGNVRWATRSEQGRNSRQNVLLTINGKTRCVTEWAEVSGTPASTIRDRLRAGVGVERSVFAPKQRGRSLENLRR